MGDQPWGLSGEQFLEWYFIGLGCALALAVVIKILPKLSGAGNLALRPTAVETGFLAGGPERAVETAVAELLAAGALRADSGGLLRATGADARPSAVGAQVLMRVTSSHTLRAITEYLRTRPALWNIGHELAELGLLVPPHIATRYRRASTLPLLLVLLVGIVRWGNGFYLGRAIGLLTAALLGTIVLGVILLNFRRGRHLRTFAGDRALREFRRAPVTDAATAVALDGVGEYPDARIALALQKSTTPPRRRQLTGSDTGAAAGGFFFGGGGGGCGGGGGGCGGGGGGGGGGCGG
ncbi:TIGR04222 domain-containing membrane protein [Kutzneria sp. NPDC052558]|uniref:TIGR04222 domain-containing membrane protein n=1 Tax=Kutzneria sp. NPDC052558 TaxID=3364121 RepID=UPI0037C9A4F9